MSIGLGALARCAGSIWPAVVAHATVDAIYFLSAASGIAPWFVQHPPPFAETGVDATFLAVAVLLPVSIAAAVFVLRRIAALRPDSTGPRESFNR